jgi:hypothetical protein
MPAYQRADVPRPPISPQQDAARAQLGRSGDFHDIAKVFLERRSIRQADNRGTDRTGSNPTDSKQRVGYVEGRPTARGPTHDDVRKSCE